MATKRVSQLTELTAAASGDYLPILQSSTGQTKKVTVKNLVGLPDIGWTATGESWTYSSWNSTTNTGVVTIPSDGTTKYAVGMFVRWVQTTGGTKYGVIIAVTATTMSIWTAGAYTLTNEALSTIVYSPLAHPVGLPPSIADGVPYKFSVYRTAALNSGAAISALVPYDTKNYDTNGNTDVVTNKGRFTAAVSGYYHFDAHVELGSATSNAAILLLYKNGAQFGRGLDYRNSSTNKGLLVNENLQLNAGDYVEVYLYTDVAVAYDVTGASNSMFSGYLYSR